MILQKPTNHQGIQYEYFLCMGRLSKKTKCTLPAVPVDWLEEQIDELYHGIEVPTELLPTIGSRLRQQLALQNSARSDEQSQLKAQQQATRRKQEKLLEVFYDQVLPMELMAREQKQLERSLAQVERRLQAIDGNDEKQEELLEIALDLAANCHEAYAKASPANKRLLNLTFFETVLIFSNDDERHAHAHLNPMDAGLPDQQCGREPSDRH